MMLIVMLQIIALVFNVIKKAKTIDKRQTKICKMMSLNFTIHKIL